MRISSAFPSTYLKAADLQGKTARVVMRNIVMEDIGGDHKPVLYFQGKEKGMVLNKTNANNIASAYGDDTDGWGGGEIELFPAMVDFQGRSVEAIRARVPPRRANQVGEAVTMPNARERAEADAGAFDDEIPF